MKVDTSVHPLNSVFYFNISQVFRSTTVGNAKPLQPTFTMIHFLPIWGVCFLSKFPIAHLQIITELESLSQTNLPWIWVVTVLFLFLKIKSQVS